MSTTPELIEALAAAGAPVRRLQAPLARFGHWTLIAGLVLLLLAVLHGVRPDLVQRLREPMFLLGLAGALGTGMSAAMAAFCLSLPDRARHWAWLPAPALLLWLSVIGYGCLTDWIVVAAGEVTWGATARCFATVVLTSVPLAMAMLFMLRHAALLWPTPIAMMGALAIAGVAATALAVLHSIDATLMVLLWNLGMAALIVGVARTFGRRMFEWMWQAGMQR